MEDGNARAIVYEADESSSALVHRSHIPNALSVARVPLSLTLLALQPFTAPFVIVYVLCGLTDALDGWAARKLHAESRLGSRLDSIADFTFFAVALYIFLKAFEIPLAVLCWAAGIIAVRCAGLLGAFVKYRTWAALHTFAFKAFSFTFFIFPLLALNFGELVAGAILCGIGTYATAEELYINARSSLLDTDTRGVR